MNVKEFIVGFLLITLFIIAFIGFGIEFGRNNNAMVNIQNDSRISDIYTGLNDTLYDYDDSEGSIQKQANQSSNAFNQEDPSNTGSEGIFFRAITAVGKSIMGIGNSIFEITLDPLLKIVLPNSPEIRKVVGVVLTTILLFVITLLAWKLYRVGY